MFKEIGWLLFDVGSTIMNEQTAYEHRIRDIADAANTTYAFAFSRETVYNINIQTDAVIAPV